MSSHICVSERTSARTEHRTEQFIILRVALSKRSKYIQIDLLSVQLVQMERKLFFSIYFICWIHTSICHLTNVYLLTNKANSFFLASPYKTGCILSLSLVASNRGFFWFACKCVELFTMHFDLWRQLLVWIVRGKWQSTAPWHAVSFTNWRNEKKTMFWIISIC